MRGSRRARRATGVAAATAALTAALTVVPGPAVSDSTITVPANAVPDTRVAQLALVGCGGLYDRGLEPLQPYVSRGPGDRAGLGDRSIAYDLAGGNAVGPLFYRDSMTGTDDAGLKAWAPAGASGVAYAGYQAPEAEGSVIWIGRAPLKGAGRWADVDVTGLTYTWTRYDMSTARPAPGRGSKAPAPSTVAAFAADHGGDGAGFYTAGFGCDGQKFLMDAWRVGSPGRTTTWDLEGLSTTTTSTTRGRTVRPGQSVSLTATLRDNAGATVPGGRLVLQSREAGTGTWVTEAAAPAADGSASAQVAPTATTTYRWVFADRPLATGSSSAPVTIRVGPR